MNEPKHKNYKKMGLKAVIYNADRLLNKEQVANCILCAYYFNRYFGRLETIYLFINKCAVSTYQTALPSLSNPPPPTPSLPSLSPPSPLEHIFTLKLCK